MERFIETMPTIANGCLQISYFVVSKVCAGLGELS